MFVTCVIGSSDSEFSVKSQYPYFSRTYPDISKEVYQMVGVLTYQKWRKVAVLYTADVSGSAMFAIFGTLARQRGIRILTSVIPNDPAATVQDLIEPLNVLKQR